MFVLCGRTWGWSAWADLSLPPILCPCRSECDGLSIASIIVKPLPKLIGGSGDLIGTTREVWKCAEAYRSDHPGFVLAAFIIVYVLFQTFAIPGPIVLSILSGALYPRWEGCFLGPCCWGLKVHGRGCSCVAAIPVGGARGVVVQGPPFGFVQEVLGAGVA